MHLAQREPEEQAEKCYSPVLQDHRKTCKPNPPRHLTTKYMYYKQSAVKVRKYHKDLNK